MHSKELPSMRKGGGHQSYILYSRSAGRRSSVYVPDLLAEQVQTAIDNGRELRRLMNEAGPLRERLEDGAPQTLISQPSQRWISQMRLER